ncbi:T9SS type A sorting domain-containing protein [candidate division KSB1 bacterium]|nr:T9SS type A sorting domain-containing protein [candidate division KSB1 bacterium]
MNESDDIPDIAIGRFPVNDVEQLGNIVEKTIRFETNITRDDYFHDFLVLADSTDGEYFTDMTEAFVETLLPTDFDYTRIDLNNQSVYHGTRDDFVDAINQNHLFFTYYGHANSIVFNHEQFFTAYNVDLIHETSLPFVFTTIGCQQQFDLDTGQSIVEKFITKASSGAVATFASTGYTYAHIAGNIISSFYEACFENPQSSIGMHVLNAKRDVLNKSGTNHSRIVPSLGDHQVVLSVNAVQSRDFIRRFTLLGDPALKLPLNIIAAQPDVDPSLPTAYALLQNYPNPFNAETVIRFSLQTRGQVSLKVYNIMGREITTLANGMYHSGAHQVRWNAIDVPSGLYFYRLETNQFCQTMKLILQK